jgi:hypothetical protein
MPSYASFNVALSLCMIMAVIALLVGRSQSFASPHFVLSMSSTRASVTTQDFINFWGKFFAFALLEMIEISQGFKTFESI